METEGEEFLRTALKIYLTDAKTKEFVDKVYDIYKTGNYDLHCLPILSVLLITKLSTDEFLVDGVVIQSGKEHILTLEEVRKRMGVQK